MKNAVLALALLTNGVILAGELSTPDNTKSVLAPTDPVVATAAPIEDCRGPACVVYKNRKHMAPCAVPTAASLCVSQTGYDACCQKVTAVTQTIVPICAPPCPSKLEVRSSRNGGRVVYDYGRYEAVVKDQKDGTVEVRYRKRLLDR